jgi:predicted enzyme related to lactoylglutathione lyase
MALIEGVTAALIGVRGVAAHLDLYCGQLGFEVASTDVIPAATASALWGGKLPDIAVTVLAAASAPTGRIALLTIPGLDPVAHPHTADLGLEGIDIYTKDIKATHKQLAAAGYPWQSPPETYDVPLEDGSSVTVTEGMCLAPDGTVLVFVEPANPRGTAAWNADPDRDYTELTSVVCHVPNADAEIMFWTRLGLSIWYDVTFSATGLEQMTGLPAGTRLRLAFVAGPATARIEVTSVVSGASGVDRRGATSPGRALGHTGWVMRCSDLAEALSQSSAAGGTVVGGPVPLGNGRAASILTPNGISVTFIQ